MNTIQLIGSLGLIGCGLYLVWVAVRSWLELGLATRHALQLMGLGGLSIFVGSLNFMF